MEPKRLTLWSAAWWGRVYDLLRERGFDVRVNDPDYGGWTLYIPGSQPWVSGKSFGAADYERSRSLITSSGHPTIELVSADPEYAVNVIHYEYLRFLA